MGKDDLPPSRYPPPLRHVLTGILLQVHPCAVPKQMMPRIAVVRAVPLLAHDHLIEIARSWIRWESCELTCSRPLNYGDEEHLQELPEWEGS